LPQFFYAHVIPSKGTTEETSRALRIQFVWDFVFIEDSSRIMCTFVEGGIDPSILRYQKGKVFDKTISDQIS
jgi:hypothetical protein